MCRELQARNYRLIEGLAEAARKIQRQDKVIELLKEENENLRNGDHAIILSPLIGALKERKQQLEWELESLRNSKKVELPKVVAQALDTLKKWGYSPAGIMYHMDKPENADDCRDELSIVREYANTPRKGDLSHSDILILGLVHGYIAEPEPEKDEAASLRNEVETLVGKWWAGDISTKESLVGTFCDYIKQREDNKLPF